jgi:hypothetical protein
MLLSHLLTILSTFRAGCRAPVATGPIEVTWFNARPLESVTDGWLASSNIWTQPWMFVTHTGVEFAKYHRYWPRDLSIKPEPTKPLESVNNSSNMWTQQFTCVIMQYKEGWTLSCASQNIHNKYTINLMYIAQLRHDTSLYSAKLRITVPTTKRGGISAEQSIGSPDDVIIYRNIYWVCQ